MRRTALPEHRHGRRIAAAASRFPLEPGSGLAGGELRRTRERARSWTISTAGPRGPDRHAGPLLQHAHRAVLARGSLPADVVRPQALPRAGHSLPQRHDQRRAHPGGVDADDPGRRRDPLFQQRDQQRPRLSVHPNAGASARAGGKAPTAAAC